MSLLSLNHVAEKGRLSPISAGVAPGCWLHLVGPNGAGKSTLLARISGMSEGPGDVKLAGQSVSAWSGPELGMLRSWLPQQQVPPFAMPVWHYLLLHAHGAPLEKLAPVIDALWLADKLPRQVANLSGGEWQRVRLAAVIAQIHPDINPAGRLLLLDEPMNSLDVTQQSALTHLLNELTQKGVAIIMSSHDLNYSLAHAHQVWLMLKGNVVAQGKASEVLTPEHLHTVYALPFRRLDVDNHKVLICS
ncbi:vitamin B12-transporter ATPase [Mangrovibacter sp. MFB070]|uniref:vitamin B12 ABC transporter ATP-binding protein BtuD n=1 Tax=Mangrovibacter sp. MFB070 TaxID=1224318 RepID=UPI0004D99FEA|nr:vitamin B12 ABC transporter ATP-binding protein BtuD [Mangrovibacter sp. MFB070]KEA52843.1 vitamin B12-transporter ATPase [Mangrovibacter sp. MFB070]